MDNIKKALMTALGDGHYSSWENQGSKKWINFPKTPQELLVQRSEFTLDLQALSLYEYIEYVAKMFKQLNCMP